MSNNWIAQRLEELKITQAELATRLQLTGYEVSTPSISHWVTGRYHPPLKDPQFRDAMAQALQLSIDELLLRANYRVSSTGGEAAQRAAEIVDQLPPDAQALALDYLRLLETRFPKTKVANKIK